MNSSLPDTRSGIDFSAKQAEFAAFIKDPKNKPAPADVEPQRMDMYRQLFFNNIEGFLSGNFPVIRKLLDDGQWDALVQDFYIRHKSETPHFSEIPEEFLSYLQNERDSTNDFPFLLELAHYEWVEMALSISKEELPHGFNAPEDLAAHTLRVSPLAWPLAYQFPVHKIAPSFIPTQAPEQPTFLIVYRDVHDEVHFMEITPMTYRLLEIIQEHENMATPVYLMQLAEESGHPKPEMIIAGGLEILKDLVDKAIVLVS